MTQTPDLHKNQPPGSLDLWGACHWLVEHGWPDDYKNRIDFTLMHRFGLGPKNRLRPNRGRVYFYPADLKRWISDLDKALAENLRARALQARVHRQHRKERQAQRDMPQ